MKPGEELINLGSFTSDGYEQLCFSLVLLNIRDYYTSLCALSEMELKSLKELSKTDRMKIGKLRNKIYYAKRFFIESHIALCIADCYMPNTYMPDLIIELDRKFVKNHGKDTLDKAKALYELINDEIPIKLRYDNEDQIRTAQSIKKRKDYIREYKRERYHKKHPNARRYRTNRDNKKRGETL